MSFDARSRERLEALGRQLPKKLPVPEPAAASGSGRPQGGEGRHRVETEQNPEQLFRELINASADGSVPPHLLDRLRALEAPRRARTDAVPMAGPAAATPAPSQARRSGRSGAKPAQPPRGAAAAQGEAHRDLYTEFQALLLEGDDDA